MAYSITKSPDGDISLGNLRAELVTLKPSASDYATGGYLIRGVGGATIGSGNVGIAKVLFAIPVAGQGGYNPVFNPVTSKLQMYQGPGALGPDLEVPAGTDLSALSFQLLVVGI